MPNAVAGPSQQDERSRLDDLERNFDAPAAREKDAVPADELERHFAMPSAKEPVYEDPGNVPAASPGSKKTGKEKSKDINDSSGPGSNADSTGGKSFYRRSDDGRHDELDGLARIKPTFRGAIGFAKNNRGKLVFGGAATGFVTLAIIAFLALIPFKIMHIVNNLQNRFTASATNAIETETEALFSNYVKTYILAAHRQCGAVIDSSCNPIPVTSNPVTRLYHGWRTANFEQQLKSKYGLEFGYNRYSHKYYMKVPLSTNDIDLTGFMENNPENLSLADWAAANHPSGLKPADIGELRSELRDATQGLTLWKRTYVRFRFSNYLHEKFGAPKCVFFCDTAYGKTKDKFANALADQKNAFKLVINRLVIAPRDRELGIVMECMLSGCDPTKEKSQPSTPGEDGELNGAPESSVEKQARQTLGDYAAEYGIEDATSLEDLYNQVAKEGLTQTSIERVLAKIMDKDVASASAKTTTEALSVVGWILLADQIANLVHAAANSPEIVKKLDYMVNSAAAVNLDTSFNVMNDELTTGNVNPVELGSMINSLGPVAAGADQTDLKGGTASAEESPLYNYLINNQSPKSNNNYKCDDGSTPAATSVDNAVCPEEKLGSGDNKYLDYLRNALTKPSSQLYIIYQAANLWSFASKALGVSSVIKDFNSVLSSVLSAPLYILDKGCIKVSAFGFTTYINPLASDYCRLRDGIKAGSKYIGQAMVKYLVPSPFSTNMSGARTFDMMAAGSDVAGNEYAHNGLGGKELTPDQVTANLNQQGNEDYQNYLDRPVLARIFDTSSNYSPITKLAMAMPMGKTDAVQSVASFFTNPFKDLGSAFGPIFNLNHAYAAAGAQPDPFGVVQYGYSADDPDLVAANKDPEKYWDTNCASGKQTTDWNNAAAEGKPDANTGMPINKTTNPCLLIQSTVVADGALFDSSLLSQDDQGNTNPSTAGTDATSSSGSDSNATTSTAGASIDMTNLQSDSTSVACASGTNDLGIQQGWAGGKEVNIRICAIPGLPSSGEESSGGYGVTGANGLAVVNSRVSGAFLALVQAAKKDGLSLSATSSFRSMSHQKALCSGDPGCSSGTDYTYVAKPGTSNHQMGLAVDFAMADRGKFTNSHGTCIDVSGRCEAPGDKVWEWLNTSAGNFGIKPYVNEYWHWSPTGN